MNNIVPSPEPYFTDSGITLWHGDALEVLRTLPDESVDCCVTSPPYYGLRDYGSNGQYGLEASPAEYVETMRTVFAEVRRVLAADGTCWVNLGDSYASAGSATSAQLPHLPSQPSPSFNAFPQSRHLSSSSPAMSQVSPKGLTGTPWRLALAMQDDGWILRNSIVWHKTNAMPESVVDRLSRKHELFFVLTKLPHYWFNLDPIRIEQSAESVARATRSDMRSKPGWTEAHHGNPPKGLARQSSRDTSIGANPGDVWRIATQHGPGDHFAVMPVALAERAVQAGCKPGGVVLDPFSGSGTTGLAAARHGRRYVGIDLSRGYLDLSLRTRLAQTSLLDSEETA